MNTFEKVMQILSDENNGMMSEIENSVPSNAKNRDLSLACLKIVAISDKLEEMKCTDLIPEQVSIIKDCIATLQRYDNSETAKKHILIGEHLLDTCTVLESHPFVFD